MPDGSLTAIVMAKPPVPGLVKTRLTSLLTPQQAAKVHEAMALCTINRFLNKGLGWGRTVLAIDEPPTAWTLHVDGVVRQGTGDLGERMLRVWQDVGAGPVIFFGTDTPDAPLQCLAGLHGRWDQGGQVVLGPAEDGGYWTLASRTWQPGLMTGIDWGTANVYDQTRQAAERLGLRVVSLPTWQDVDQPEDLVRLRQRLTGSVDSSLSELARALNHIMEPSVA